MKRKLLAMTMIVLISSMISGISVYALELPFVPAETEEQDNQNHQESAGDKKDNAVDESKSGQTEDDDVADSLQNESIPEKKEAAGEDEGVLPIMGVHEDAPIHGQVVTGNSKEEDVPKEEEGKDQEDSVVHTARQEKEGDSLWKVIVVILAVVCITVGVSAGIVIKRKKNREASC